MAAGAVEQAVNFRLWDPVMPSGSMDTSNLFLVYPLFDRGKADAELHGGIAQVQHHITVLSRFAGLRG